MTLLYTALINLLVLTAIFVPLERVFPARVQRIVRPQLVLDGCFFLGQYLVTTTAILAVLRALTPLQSRALTDVSPIAQVVVAVVAGDFVVYWFHRACHRFEMLWRFHAVHHTSEHLDWVAAHREHPFDGIATATLMNLPAIVLGVRPELLAGIAIFRACWAIFVHSNTRVPLGPLAYVLGAPELHHWHHSKVRARANTGHNFANLAPYWDVVFGTHHCPHSEEHYELGIDEAYPESYPALLAWPIAGRRRSIHGRIEECDAPPPLSSSLRPS
jgi:sterol desaturase/sphingolipid hydroxylase (fatty acid hydroxylase superfamily)